MRYLTTIFFILILALTASAQESERIDDIRNRLELLSASNEGLDQRLDTSIALNEVSLPNFLLALSNVHEININIAPGLENITIANNFSDVKVSDVLLFLCKEYDLDIEFTNNILSVRPFVDNSPPESYRMTIDYDPVRETIAIDVKENEVHEVFRAIMDASAKNLMFSQGMEDLELTAYFNPTDFDTAMDKLALANNLVLTRTDDGFYVFDLMEQKEQNSASLRQRIGPDLNYKVLDSVDQILEVDFRDVPIKTIISRLGESLGLDIFIASPLDNAGNATIRTGSISFDELLVKIFEPQESVDTTVESGQGQQVQRTTRSGPGANTDGFSFKKEDGIYFFGTKGQLSVRKVEIVNLKHRSVNMMADPSAMVNGSDIQGNYLMAEQGFRNQVSGNFNNQNLSGNRPQTGSFTRQGNDGQTEIQGDILGLIPQEVKDGLECKVDVELNSIYVTGTGAKIEYFKEFVRKIDKAIPVILIEVMIVEAQVTNTVETGVEWGLGEGPATTQGNLFPSTDLTLGARTINRIISGFSSTSAFNFGRVVPNFFATVKAMETNGDLKIRSTPKLATLNGHRASFSNGQTSYYAIVQRNIIGSDNPLTTEIRNYFPIDAKLGLEIKPFVTGDKQVLLDINVIQSNFGQRIADDAPPDISSRNFSSVVRMKDQDIAVLGGLEENYSNNSGSGVPFLARIPIIKWLFSKRVREGRKSKLTVFIKPTVIY